MQFHFEKTLEKRFEPQNQVADGTPAWRVLWLAKALRDWFGQPHRTFYQSGSCQVQFGYEALSFPVSDFASFFGAMVGGIGRVWPVQVFGLGDGNELVELSVIEDNGTFALRQRSIPVSGRRASGSVPHTTAQPPSASGVFRLLKAAGKRGPPPPPWSGTTGSSWRGRDCRRPTIPHPFAMCFWRMIGTRKIP